MQWDKSILLFNHNSVLKGEIYIAKRGMVCFGSFKKNIHEYGGIKA